MLEEQNSIMTGGQRAEKKSFIYDNNTTCAISAQSDRSRWFIGHPFGYYDQIDEMLALIDSTGYWCAPDSFTEAKAPAILTLDLIDIESHALKKMHALRTFGFASIQLNPIRFVGPRSFNRFSENR